MTDYSYYDYEPCPSCDGRGFRDIYELVPCKQCEATGDILKPQKPKDIPVLNIYLKAYCYIVLLAIFSVFILPSIIEIVLILVDFVKNNYGILITGLVFGMFSASSVANQNEITGTNDSALFQFLFSALVIILTLLTMKST